MFFGLATLLLIVIVVELTASAGGVVGLGLEPVLFEFEPHAMIAPAAAAAHVSSSTRLFIHRIPQLDPETSSDVKP